LAENRGKTRCWRRVRVVHGGDGVG
jgi:hypothetical protein